MSEEVEILISLAVSMEKERAERIVADVLAENIGGTQSLNPTGFESGYQTACEEILHRLRDEEWQYSGAVFDSTPNASFSREPERSGGESAGSDS